MYNMYVPALRESTNRFSGSGYDSFDRCRVHVHMYSTIRCASERPDSDPGAGGLFNRQPSTSTKRIVYPESRPSLVVTNERIGCTFSRPIQYTSFFFGCTERDQPALSHSLATTATRAESPSCKYIHDSRELTGQHFQASRSVFSGKGS